MEYNSALLFKERRARHMSLTSEVTRQQAFQCFTTGRVPQAVELGLKALRQKYQPKRLLCVFQPHQHSRTRVLLQDFAESFAQADETIVPDLYFVRDSEAERQSVSSADLVERINAHGQRARHLPQFDQIVEHLREEASEGDLIVTMGAGNVWEIGRDLVSET